MAPVSGTQTRSAQGAANVNLPTTVETVVATLPGISTQGAQTIVNLNGWVAVTPGTAATGVTVRIRRGIDTTGQVVGVADAETGGIAAAGTRTFDVAETDQPGDVASQSYVLTVQQVGATGAGTAVQSNLTAQLTG